jgi:hypothetical protein
MSEPERARGGSESAAAGVASNSLQPTSSEPEPGAALSRNWKQWLFLLVPAVAVAELLAQLVQVKRVPAEQDWRQAREVAKTMLRAEDGLLFAPWWSEPLGRMYFGGDLATMSRMAPPDYSRFDRVLEVSIRGQHRSEVESWQPLEQRRIGAVRLRMLKNPSPVQVLEDLVELATPSHLSVQTSADGSTQRCAYSEGTVQTGGTGFGPAIPGKRFTCPGSSVVGVTVIPPLDYKAHQCIYAPPPGGRTELQLRFAGVRFGQRIHGYHSLYAEGERMHQGTPVTLTFRARDRVLGTAVHNDGDGWIGFEVQTHELDGSVQELVVQISSPTAQGRSYCFAADTRRGRAP